MISEILQDAFFAAIAAVGFASISNPPKRAYLYCTIISAAGHSLRFILMKPDYIGMHIVIATIIASFALGSLAVILSRFAKTPAEACVFPSLLPMIPGVYAYKTFGGIAMCLFNCQEQMFNHYIYLVMSNALTCLFVLLGMVVGGTVPIFILKKLSFQATR